MTAPRPTWVGYRIEYLMRVLGLSRAKAGEQARRELANAESQGITLVVPE